MKVVVTDYIEPDLDWEAKCMREMDIAFQACQLKFAGEKQLLDATWDADIVVVNMAPITAGLVEQWQRCSLVIRHGVGYDNVDVSALTRRGIRFANIPDYCVEEVAEHTISLIFALARKILPSRTILERSSRQGRWEFSEVEPIYRMKGQTLGIIGVGRIGARILEKLRSFGFSFLLCDPYLSSARQDAVGIELVSHEEVYRKSDFIALHTPLNAETRHLINERTLALMKPSAFLINTARAGLIDHVALYRALKDGRLAGAAIDVFDPEPPRNDNPLFELQNVVLTPHLAWYSVEAGLEIRHKIVQQIQRFKEGLPPLNWVNERKLQFQGVES
jgi:D-3-phosphoglycerate dehydrogenase